MIILADENIPYVREAFGTLGEVRALPAREITPESARGAGALLVRSVTRVDRALLAGSRIRFVGTATAGADHVDQEFLQSEGIAFAPAPGSNAESVAQYIAAALAHLRRVLGRDLQGGTLGIIGAGQCGSRVARIARAFGMESVLCDPPLERLGTGGPYHPLGDLRGCDIVTLHVPMIRSGPDRTEAMIGEAFLRGMKPGAVIINAARGGVVDERALIAELEKAERKLCAVIDTWSGEPAISAALLRAAAIGTPHIAGYSFDGKVRGTEMIYRALCDFLGRSPSWSAAACLPPVAREIMLDPHGRSVEETISRAILDAYPIMRDDAALREGLKMDETGRARLFESLRKNYHERREFAATRIAIHPDKADIARALGSLGFTLDPPKCG